MSCTARGPSNCDAGRHINVGLDGVIEMSAEDAQYYVRHGWTKLAEWTTEDAV